MVKEIFKFSIRRLIQTKINGGIVLLFVALAAMLIANSPLQEYYNILLSKTSHSRSEVSISLIVMMAIQ